VTGHPGRVLFGRIEILVRLVGERLGTQRQRKCQLKKIYVGNLNFQTTDDELRTLFGEYGQVTNATVITDRDTGRSRGFGFVEMEDDSAAMNAISGINGRDVEGRQLSVNEARPRQPRGGSRW